MRVFYITASCIRRLFQPHVGSGDGDVGDDGDGDDGDDDDDGDDGDVGAAAHEFSLLAALVTSRGLAHQVGTLHFYQINPRLEIYIEG